MSYDLFISYADADRAWVEGYLLDALERAGVRCHSQAAFALGVPRLLEFERAVRESRRTVLVLSPAYLAENLAQFADLLAQTYGLETATWPVIPLLLRPVALPPRLALLVALDATDPANWPLAVERLCAAMQLPAPAAPARPPCPYPGMAPFREADSAAFFGRERETEALLAQLRLHPFLAVIGPSGSGKSSLVFAGLLPALRRSGLFGPGGWRVTAMRPGEHPLACLPSQHDASPDPPTLVGTPTLDGNSPHAWGAERANSLFIIDQFEEVFTRSGAEALPFQQALLHLAQTPGCYVVLTIRADFYSDLMSCPLWPQIQAHRCEVLPLNSDGLRQAIVRPAERAGVYVEAALVERLVADAAGEPGVLPLIQETLVLLWERLERRFLPLSAYEALILSVRAYRRSASTPSTGLQVAIAQRADAALAKLSPAQQMIARRVLLRLVQFGEGRADTRRQQPMRALRSAGDQPGEPDRVVEHLVQTRLLTLSGAAEGDERPVDMAHEALIAGWPTLGAWLQERRSAELVRRRLEGKTAEWVRLGRGGGGLLDAEELAEAEPWLAGADAADLGASADLLALVAGSRAAVRQAEAAQAAQQQRDLTLGRQARLRRTALLAGVAALLLVAVGVGGRQLYLRQAARAGAVLRPVLGQAVAFEAYEVTVERYDLCVQAGRCSASTSSRGQADLPITGVDAMQAAAFCRWIGRRLPTSAEWELAATHGGATRWPWGDAAPTPERANLIYVENSPVAQPLSQIAPVGGRSAGATPEGIHDLIGNVFEWTATTWIKPGQPGSTWDDRTGQPGNQLITVGGSYISTVRAVSAAGRTSNTDATFRAEYLGLRCVE